MLSELQEITRTAGKIPAIKLIAATGMWGTAPHPNITSVVIKIGSRHCAGQKSGNGVIDSAFKAVMEVCQLDATLEKYDVHTKEGVGADGVGRVIVWILYEKQLYKGIVQGSNTAESFVSASIAAVNKLIRAKRKEYTDSMRRRRMTRRNQQTETRVSA